MSRRRSNGSRRDRVQREFETSIEGEVRFDAVTRALYSTDASVYQSSLLAQSLPKSARRSHPGSSGLLAITVSLTMRGGGTSQAGQAIGAGLQVDTSKYYNQILELNVEERWVRVQPGIVLDELNAVLRPHGLRFAPDVSTASRATIGGMIANNSSGARSVLYGKTIDHVIELEVVLADGSVSRLGAGIRCCRSVSTQCCNWLRSMRMKSTGASRKCCVASADTTSMSLCLGGSHSIRRR